MCYAVVENPIFCPTLNPNTYFNGRMEFLQCPLNFMLGECNPSLIAGDVPDHPLRTDFSGNSREGAFTKSVVDTTPPIPECAEGGNPDGETPNAPGNDGKGQNQDGYYLLLAEDIVDLDPDIFVVDIGADDLFGSGDDYILVPSLIRTISNRQKPMAQNLA
jgi:hypothetical protein